MIEPCTGCRFLRDTPVVAVCAAQDAVRRVYDPYTQKERWSYGLRPTVAEMRGVGRPCGPDRVLYQPSWWRRIWRR